MQGAISVLGVVAVTEFAKRLKARDFMGAGVIVVAGIVGVLAGFFGIAGLTVMTGFVAGMGAIGLHVISKNVGGIK